jgi:hypothetical protein
MMPLPRPAGFAYGAIGVVRRAAACALRHGETAATSRWPAFRRLLRLSPKLASLESGLLTSERSDAGCRAFLVTASNTVPATASGRLFCACVTLGRFCCRSLQPQPTALKPAQIKEVTSRPLVRPPENRADREALAGIGEKKPTEKGWFCEFWWPSAESNHGHADFQSDILTFRRVDLSSLSRLQYIENS